MAFKDEVGSLDRIATALEGLAEAEGSGIPTPKVGDAGKVLMVDAEGKWTLASVLPSVTSGDAGEVLTVDAEGKWESAAVPSQLPSVTSEDSGRVLTVNESGEWVAADPGGK